MAFEQILARAKTVVSTAPQIARGYVDTNSAFANREVAQAEVKYINSQKANSAHHYGTLGYVDGLKQHLIGRNIHYKHHSSAISSDSQALRRMLNNLLLDRKV